MMNTMQSQRSGNIGTKGELGEKGETGLIGDKGTTGQKGERGDHGLTGSKGERVNLNIFFLLPLDTSLAIDVATYHTLELFSKI